MLPGGASELQKTVRILCWHVSLLHSPAWFQQFEMKIIIGSLGINLRDDSTPDTQIIIMNSENCLKEHFTFAAHSIT